MPRVYISVILAALAVVAWSSAAQMDSTHARTEVDGLHALFGQNVRVELVRRIEASSSGCSGVLVHLGGTGLTLQSNNELVWVPYGAVRRVTGVK